MHPDITRLSLGTGNAQAPMSSVYNPNNRQPQYASRRIDIRDITKEFTDASSELQQGQLIKDDFFTLFEAVGALEIMDPKMDSGLYIPEKDDVVDNFDPLQKLLPEEVVGVMDQLFCFEMAWHGGHALSQTLFTSLHMYSLLSPYFRPLSAIVFNPKTKQSAEQADPLISSILRAFCLGILKSCDSVIQEITSEHYYEEEDFVTQTFAQYILSDYGSDEIILEIQEAIKILEQQDLPTDIKDALKHRLELRIHLLKAFEPLTVTEVVDKTPMWQDVLSSLASVNASVNLGTPTPHLFSERVQRHLASNTPPTPTIHLTWTETHSRFLNLCNDNIRAHNLLSLPPTLGPQNLFRLAWNFSSRKPQPSTYSRAVMQGLLFKGGRVLLGRPHLDLLLEDIRALVLAGSPVLDASNWDVEVPQDPRFVAARKVDEFMGKALEEYINIPRMTLQNRCRIRRTFCQSIPIHDSLQAEAETVDSELHILLPSPTPAPQHFYPLAAWSYFHKLRIMELSISLGFELEVYQPQELASMYRFLAFVATTRVEHLEHIDFFLSLRERKLKRENSGVLVTQVQESRAKIEVLILQATVTAELASALSSLYALLTSLHLVPTTAKDAFSTPELRHELRMKPYLPIGTPTLPSYEELAAATNLQPSTSFPSVFNTITARLNDAKIALGKLKGVSAEQGAFVGCEEGWGLQCKGLLGTIVAAGLVVVVIRKVVEELGLKVVGSVEGDKVKGKLRCEEVAEKRFLDFWVLPKVVGV